MSEGAPLIRSPLALAVVTTLAVAAFVLVLAVAAFLLRDAPLGVRPPPARVVEVPRSTTGTTTRPDPAGRERPPPGALERQSASTAVAPVFPGCYREARARDPSLAREVELLVGLDTRPGGGTITSLRVGRGGSPFLLACLREQLVGAGFPAGADGVGIVTWRARLEGDEAVLVEVAP